MTGTNRTLQIFTLSSQASREKTIPFIQAAQELGWNTVVGCTEADDELLIGDANFIFDPYSWPDIESHVRKHNPSRLLTQNTRLTPILAPIAEALNISTYTPLAATVLNHKDQLGRFFREHFDYSLRSFCPTTEEDFKLKDWLNTPIVLKPTFSTGGANTFLFSSMSELVDNLNAGTMKDTHSDRPLNLRHILAVNNDPSSESRFLIQEQVDATKQIGIEVFVFNGKVHNIYSAEIITASNRVNAVAHLGYLEPPKEVITALQKMADLLGIYNAHMTPDILLSKNGKFYVVDVNMNVGSEGLLESVKKAGFDLPRHSLDALLNNHWAPPDLSDQKVVSAGLPTFADCSRPQVAAISTPEYDRLLTQIKNLQQT